METKLILSFRTTHQWDHHQVFNDWCSWWIIFNTNILNFKNKQRCRRLVTVQHDPCLTGFFRLSSSSPPTSAHRPPHLPKSCNRLLLLSWQECLRSALNNSSDKTIFQVVLHSDFQRFSRLEFSVSVKDTWWWWTQTDNTGSSEINNMDNALNPDRCTLSLDLVISSQFADILHRPHFLILQSRHQLAAISIQLLLVRFVASPPPPAWTNRTEGNNGLNPPSTHLAAGEGVTCCANPFHPLHPCTETLELNNRGA